MFKRITLLLKDVTLKSNCGVRLYIYSCAILLIGKRLALPELEGELRLPVSLYRSSAVGFLVLNPLTSSRSICLSSLLLFQRITWWSTYEDLNIPISKDYLLFFILFYPKNEIIKILKTAIVNHQIWNLFYTTIIKYFTERPKPRHLTKLPMDKFIFYWHFENGYWHLSPMEIFRGQS